jgi:phosphopantetheinyl transferase
MPLFYQQNINATTEWAVWHIVETEETFASDVAMDSKIMHPNRRLQHMVGRWLLSHIMQKEVQNDIDIAPNGKPYFKTLKQQFSISHCHQWAAVIVSDQKVGVDIEIISERVQKVKHKFLHSKENDWLEAIPTSEQLAQLTFIWAAKEAMYKWLEQLGIDFKEQLIVESAALADKGIVKGSIEHDGIVNSVYLHYSFFENVVSVTCIAS